MANVLAGGGGLKRSASSIKKMAGGHGAFQGRSARSREELALKWAAIERLPTFERLKVVLIPEPVGDGGTKGRKEVDVTKLGAEGKRQLMESVLKVAEEDNEEFLRRLRERTNRCIICLFYCLVHCFSLSLFIIFGEQDKIFNHIGNLITFSYLFNLFRCELFVSVVRKKGIKMLGLNSVKRIIHGHC